MTVEKQEELLFQINGKLSEINTKLDTINSIIIKHESRITNLEITITKHLTEYETKGEVVVKDDGFKNDMLKLLAKALIISITSIASLCGAGSLLCKIWGN